MHAICEEHWGANAQEVPATRALKDGTDLCAACFEQWAVCAGCGDDVLKRTAEHVAYGSGYAHPFCTGPYEE